MHFSAAGAFVSAAPTHNSIFIQHLPEIKQHDGFNEHEQGSLRHAAHTSQPRVHSANGTSANPALLSYGVSQ
jgi:hypothetical protein